MLDAALWIVLLAQMLIKLRAQQSSCLTSACESVVVLSTCLNGRTSHSHGRAAGARWPDISDVVDMLISMLPTRLETKNKRG